MSLFAPIIPGSGGPPNTSTWYPLTDSQLAIGVAQTANTAVFWPFRVPRAITISDLAARVTTLHAANNFQLAIYANNPATNRPTGSELGKTASISTAATGALSAVLAGGNITLVPGVVYWAACNTSSSTVVLTSMASANNYTAYIVGAATLADVAGSNTGCLFLTTPLTFNTWGSVTSAVWTPSASNIAVAMWNKAV